MNDQLGRRSETKRFGQELSERTFEFGVRIVKLVRSLPKDTAGFVLGSQICRSGTSIGANTEEAQGAQTKAEFVRKMNIAKSESRETLYWLRLIRASGMVRPNLLDGLLHESDELRKILTKVVRTSQGKT